MPTKKHPKAIHAPLAGFPVQNGMVTIGGIGIDRLANRVGSTPFYVYDSAIMADQVAALRQVMPAQLKLHYAMKANPMPAVVQHMGRLVDGVDVASAGEMAVALNSGVAADAISFAGPGKTDADLARAIAADVTLNVESAGELDRIIRIAQNQGVAARIAIRVNPDFELKASGMKMGGGPQQFGIDSEMVPALLQNITEQQIPESVLIMNGFHIFSGSQNLNEDNILDSQEKALALAVSLAAYAPGPVRSVNIGGGFGIPYFPGERALNIEKIGAGLNLLMQKFQSKMPDTEVIIELGRYLVGESGLYVTKIIDKKTSRGKTYLVTDGGLHHHLAASGNFGQLFRKNYPVAIGRMNPDSDEQEEVNIVGCLCTPLDRLGDRMLLPKAAVGDYVIVFQSGAYGRSASPTSFLGHAPPQELLLI